MRTRFARFFGYLSLWLEHEWAGLPLAGGRPRDRRCRSCLTSAAREETASDPLQGDPLVVEHGHHFQLPAQRRDVAPQR